MTRPDRLATEHAMAQQLAFDLPPNDPAQDRASFALSACNQTAFAMVDRHHDGALLLVGPQASGKSHLAMIWAQAHSARRRPAGDLQTQDVPDLLNRPLVIEDHFDLSDAAERAMFHLLNLCQAEGGLVLITAQNKPTGWARLPDLASRLQALPRATLNAPDDEALAAVLTKQLKDRQMPVSSTAIQYALSHMERSYAEARRLATAFDRHALATRREITRNVVMDVMAMQDSDHENS